MKPTESRIFGPVPSRRLGLSLGVDLVPFKTCTYDCIYCQLGRTTNKTLECKEFFPVSNILTQLKKRLSTSNPDVITFSGSGEPTLYSKIDLIISGIKEITDLKIAILTNGSLFWNKEIRKKVLGADIILPTITTVFEETYKLIHRPHPGLQVSSLIEGLLRLRDEYNGKIFLEFFVLRGINDKEKELKAIKDVVDKIAPEKIQINTVARPPSEKKAEPMEYKELIEICKFLGKNAEVIAYKPREASKFLEDKALYVLEMIKRRPVTEKDISEAIEIEKEELQSILKGLMIKGMISKYKHLGNTYYIFKEGKR